MPSHVSCDRLCSHYPPPVSLVTFLVSSMPLLCPLCPPMSSHVLSNVPPYFSQDPLYPPDILPMPLPMIPYYTSNVPMPPSMCPYAHSHWLRLPDVICICLYCPPQPITLQCRNSLIYNILFYSIFPHHSLKICYAPPLPGIDEIADFCRAYSYFIGK